MNPKQLEKLATIISSLKSSVKCPICLDPAEVTVELECHHRFCSNCILHVKEKKLNKCPICKMVLAKRSPTYKDHFADSLGKFVNTVCEIIKEKYAHDVDSLSTGKLNLQNVIDVAPLDRVNTDKEISKKQLGRGVSTTSKTSSIDLCIEKVVNYHKKLETVLPSTDKDAKNKIDSWLSKSTTMVDKLTQTPLGDDFQMLSISQVAFAKYRSFRKRSQSLTACDSLPEPLVKRFQSLTEGLKSDDLDDYSIEEVHSETLVKQVERKVVQDLLEDECLANLDQMAQVTVKESTSAKKSKKRSSKGKKNSNDSGSSLGWDRVKEVSNSIQKAAKTPKKLNIKLKEVKKKKTVGKANSCSSVRKPKNTRSASKKGAAVSESDQIQHSPSLPNNDFNNARRTYHLSEVENHFMNHINSISIEEACSSGANRNNTTTSFENDGMDQDVFSLPTQATNQPNMSVNQMHVSPMPNDCNDLVSVTTHLRDSVKLCQFNAANFPEEYSHQLSECFVNLLTYVNKIISLSNEKSVTVKEDLAQTSRISVKTQTENISKSVAVQTVNLDGAKRIKSTQRESSKCRNVYVQTDVSREFCSSGSTSKKKGDLFAKSNNEKPATCEILKNEIIVRGDDRKLPNSTNKRASQSSSQNRISSKSSQTTKSSKPVHISVDDSKENKSSKAPSISQGTDLLISLGSSSKTQNKTKRMLTYQGVKPDRTFKRIRTMSSDSEPEISFPKKRKLLRDDLTVEFLDTEAISSAIDVENKGRSTPESEKMDYDQYLIDVMSKYDIPNTKEHTSGVPSAPKSISKLPTQIGNSQNDDHVFTDCVALEENLEKFDREIEEVQQVPRSYNTELDLVENTPLTSETLSKFGTKKPSTGIIKSFEEPERVISKGSAPIVVNHLLSPSTEVQGNSDDKTCAFNRNISALPTQSEELPSDIADILKDLNNGDNIFRSNTESLGRGDEVIRREAPCVLEPTARNIEVDDFEDDQEIEDQMKKISLASEIGQIDILQNIVLNHSDDDCIVAESDSSDVDIVETTPQKTKLNSNERSILRDLESNEQDKLDDEVLFVVPPPPGFCNDFVDNTNSELHGPTTQKENCPPPLVLNRSLTSESLTDFIVTPDNKSIQSERMVAQNNVTLNTTLLSPVEPSASKLETSRASQVVIEETEDVFSPVARPSIKRTQFKSTPCTSRSVSRSSKKTPILTSTPSQKSILNFVVPTQQLAYQKPRPCIMWSRIINKDLNVFTQVECKKLMTTSKVFTPQVTHLVVLVDERGRIVSHTAKTLQAIVAGIWVVRYEWVEDCLRLNRIVEEGPYEALDTTGEPGPQISRLTAKSKPLFKGIRFLCAMPLTSVPKSDLENIIRLAGGEVTDDLSDFLVKDGKINIIITEIMSTENTNEFEGYLDNFKTVTVEMEWISCCIGQYKLVSFRPYVVTREESAIDDLGYPPVLVESVPYTLTEAT